MVKIRLSRSGAKRRPFYRIVVADARSPRDGRFIERVGHFDPLSDKNGLVLAQERVTYWLSVGAQPTTTVTRLIRKAARTAVPA